MNEPPQPTPERLGRVLSVLGLWVLVINGIIGAGIFGLPAEAARLAGAFSPWAFLLCALGMLPIMVVFAQLASHFEGTGGPVRYADAAFGPIAGFLAGWVYYVARLTSFSANAALLAGTVGYFWPTLDEPAPRVGVLLVLCGVLTIVTVAGSRRAIGSLGVLTAAKFVPLLALVGAALLLRPGEVGGALSALVPSSEVDLGAVLLVVFYAYVGFESGLVPAGEAKNPRRDMPRALYWALGIVTVLYVMLQATSVAVLGDLSTSKRPLVEAGAALFGEVGAAVMVAGVLASVGGSLAGNLFSTPRITYALALDQRLPSAFAHVAPRLGTPVVSIVVFGTLGCIFAVAGSFAWLAGLSVLARLLIYLLCICAWPVVRRRAGRGVDRPRPLGWVAPAAGSLVCVALLAQVAVRDWLVTAAMLAVGATLYVVARRTRRRGT